MSRFMTVVVLVLAFSLGAALQHQFDQQTMGRRWINDR